MRYFGGVTDQETIDGLIDRQMECQRQGGHSLWAAEHKASGELIGICGLRIGGHPGTPVEGIYELGWRIAELYWKQGFAKEAAQVSLDWGWDNRPAQSIAAWTNPPNTSSWCLMIRLGMTHRPKLDYRHPSFPDPTIHWAIWLFM